MKLLSAISNLSCYIVLIWLAFDMDASLSAAIVNLGFFIVLCVLNVKSREANKMGIQLKETKPKIEVISYIDDAVTCTREAYEEYLKTLDESLLELDMEKAPPVRFVLKTDLDYNAQRIIKKDIMNVSKEKEMQFNIGYIMLSVRLSLCDILHTNLAELSFRKGPDGYAHEDLIALLERLEICQDLHTAQQNAVGTKVSKKN